MNPLSDRNSSAAEVPTRIMGFSLFEANKIIEKDPFHLNISMPPTEEDFEPPPPPPDWNAANCNSTKKKGPLFRCSVSRSEEKGPTVTDIV
ncbi:hypothetical protein CDAR_51451 [Caerostris darwini]|uniref:Uncharacterized protein n=1 Tax=Caerostris darwini TaxID=1538125 RepID=A0AAV4U601_9ARAC|nr:hypothetical protein CDAR_51451 [Caerostris darwini]